MIRGSLLALAAVGAALSVATGDAQPRLARPSPVPAPTVDRFDEEAAFGWLVRQVRLGPRPAGSAASRRLASLLAAALPGGRYQRVPGGLRNVVGLVPGRRPSRLVVVGAHYDTVDLPDFVGANDGASGTAVVVQLARTVRERELRPSVAFVLFDGEEAPVNAPGSFLAQGLRGSRVAAAHYRRAEAMILLDMVGDRHLSIPREGLSDPALWRQLRAAAHRVGVGSVFPDRLGPSLLDDHYPFLRRGIPAIDVIDFTFPCWHRPCDDLSAVSPGSLDAVGETVYELLRSL